MIYYCLISSRPRRTSSVPPSSSNDTTKLPAADTPMMLAAYHSPSPDQICTTSWCQRSAYPVCELHKWVVSMLSCKTRRRAGCLRSLHADGYQRPHWQVRAL